MSRLCAGPMPSGLRRQLQAELEKQLDGSAPELLNGLLESLCPIEGEIRAHRLTAIPR